MKLAEKSKSSKIQSVLQYYVNEDLQQSFGTILSFYKKLSFVVSLLM